MDFVLRGSLCFVVKKSGLDKKIGRTHEALSCRLYRFDVCRRSGANTVTCFRCASADAYGPGEEHGCGHWGGKDKLVAAVKASFQFCHEALAKADDSKLNDSITWFDGKPRPRAWATVALASSWADHYGTAAMYLRQNGLLPPSAQQSKKWTSKGVRRPSV
jgi:hypothetical protein